MKIAILYICVGRYTIFWDEFYRSAEKYFLPEEEKNYFVFTDGEIILAQEDNKVIKVFQEDLGWPFNTLFRFKMFKKVEEQLINYDYIFFFNANMLFLDKVGHEILPMEEGLVVTEHPGFYNKKRSDYTYETNPMSLAYIPEAEGQVYVCGGLNGGKAKDYLELINCLEENIQKDYENNIIAVWHDESHINHYILSHKYKLLSPSYAYPEGWKLGIKKIILIRDKNKYGGHHFLRGTSGNTTLFARLKQIIWRKP
ncbi:MAG: glycosyl transferase family 6 [Clostridia bacterium]|nr:glycosyl transferase family 6 [Clostridia bacterium]